MAITYRTGHHGCLYIFEKKKFVTYEYIGIEFRMQVVSVPVVAIIGWCSSKSSWLPAFYFGCPGSVLGMLYFVALNGSGNAS